MPDSKTSGQSARFIEAARELGCEEREDAFERAVRNVEAHHPRPSTAHASDCAACDAPAYEAGACTCGAATGGR
jgi:hypothetical protein